MVEFIGFIISLLALLFIFIKQTSSNKHQRQQSGHIDHEVIEEEEENENDPFTEYIKRIEKEAAVKEETARQAEISRRNRLNLSSPPPIVRNVKEEKKIVSAKEDKHLKSRLEDYHIKSNLREHHLKSTLEERRLVSKFRRQDKNNGVQHADSGEMEAMKPSMGKTALQRLRSKHDLVVYYEIMAKPIALRAGEPLA